MKTVTLVKHEWHQHDRQYAYELTEDILAEIYPDYDGDEISALMDRIESGEVDIEELMQAAYDENVDIEWDFQYDDCWTDRKGGYEVTFELGDETSWYDDPASQPVIPTHACTRCRWKGESWDTRTAYLDADGNIIPEDETDDYTDTKDVCPMCDGDVILTEEGKRKEEDRAKLMAELDAMMEEDEE